MSRVAIVAICLAVVLLLAGGCGQRRVHKIRGTAALLEPQISRLRRSSEQAFLVVRVAGTKDFIRLMAAPELAAPDFGVQIGFPLITERQLAMEPKIRQAAGEMQLVFHETRGSNGGRFLDCDFTGGAREIAGACRQLLVHVYGISDAAPLSFETDASM